MTPRVKATTNDASSRSNGTKTNGAIPLPEDLQAPMRERLQIMRHMMGLPRNGLPLSPGTITRLEQHDLSSAKLGDLFGIAQTLGMTLAEFLIALTGTDGGSLPSASRTQRRMLVYLRQLDEGGQMLACDLVKTLVDKGATLSEDAHAGRDTQ